MAKRLLRLCQSGEISANLVTLQARALRPLVVNKGSFCLYSGPLLRDSSTTQTVILNYVRA